MDKVVVLKGIGANEIVIIGMVFPTLEAGEAYMDEAFKPYEGRFNLE
jgi:hypothetical protein